MFDFTRKNTVQNVGIRSSKESTRNPILSHDSACNTGGNIYGDLYSDILKIRCCQTDVIFRKLLLQITFRMVHVYPAL